VPAARTCRVVDRDGAAHADLDRATAERLLGAGFFWLDLRAPTPADLGVLREVFDFHELALEDTEQFGQRPKLEEYDNHAFAVLYGSAPDDDGLVEVHCYFSERFLVTVRRDASPALDALYTRYEHHEAPETAIGLLHRLADELVDSFFPALERFDDRLDLIQDEMITRPKNEHLQDVFAMKRRVALLRRVIGPQRDLLGRISSGNVDLPGLTPEAERYFGDVYDHLIRLTETLDTHRDLMAASIDIYMSASSHRMNEVMKQLTIVATIFLPLSFVTGFFGQNFPWLVGHLGGPWWFAGLGLGTQLLTLLLLLGWYRKRGWS
jgi:magnesium transporter